jgi:FKBP-type peptidyl-prolyl cis-trans isomerase
MKWETRVRICNLVALATIFLAGSTPVFSSDTAGLDYWNEIKQPAVQTESGLQYKVLHEGKGRKPSASSTVTVHYRGLLMNGSIFDSSYNEDEPIRLSLRKVIKGWTEGIQLMPSGSTFVFLVPPELAYGERGTRGIPPNATLLFEVELYGIR